MEDLILHDPFTAKLKIAGDEDGIELRAEDSGTIVDLELGNEAMHQLRDWLSAALGIVPSAVASPPMRQDVPVVGRFEIVVKVEQ